ncbi:MAG: hypothetical protein LIO77_01555, partial [Rikenellaceae bacterium]|nr:hypothetical protein [Rikenellaceae bacterium]
MKILKLHILPALILLLAAGGCGRDPALSPDGDKGEGSALRIRVSTPGAGGGLSRAVDEDLLSEVNV